jgi:hypothetical protein
MGEPITKHSWNRELEFGLPDSRLTVDRARKMRENMTPVGRMWMEKVFCANCGCDGGAVTPEWARHIFFLCDDCAYRYGEIEGAVQVPDSVVKGENNG